MNILEYGKEEWKKSDGYFIGIGIIVEIILWIVFFFTGVDGSFWLSLGVTAVLAGVTFVLYRLARLLYKSYLILAGREWKSGNEAWALDGVRRITRQEQLEKAASRSPFPRVRERAVAGITRQDFLQERAINDPDSDVRATAVKNITRPDFLLDRAINDPNHAVRATAVKNITRPDLLLDRAINDRSWAVSRAAFWQLVNGGNMDETLLQALVSTLAGKLKGSEEVTEKRDCARYLHAIYRRHPDSSVRKDIEALDRTTIHAGSSHADTSVHSDHTDEYCHEGICYDPEHTDNTDHTDHPAEPVEIFHVKKNL
jgi:hypothetical protein